VECDPNRAGGENATGDLTLHEPAKVRHNDSPARVYPTRAAVILSVSGKFPPRLLESTKESD
jgi:hypothetical protein